MLKRIKTAVRVLFSTRTKQKHLPKAAPSAHDAIVPFDPAKYSISPQCLKRQLDKGRDIILLDVREEWEYRIVHFNGAKWIPLGALAQQAFELNPYAEIVVYCHRGMRSLDAAYLMQQLGFKRVKSLAGGIDEWARVIDSNLQQY